MIDPKDATKQGIVHYIGEYNGVLRSPDTITSRYNPQYSTWDKLQAWIQVIVIISIEAFIFAFIYALFIASILGLVWK